MPLNYAAVERNANKYIDQSLEWQAEARRLARELNGLYEQAAQDSKTLRQAIEQAELTQAALYTAKPSHEPPLASFPLPARPLNFTLLAADGSQIVPNRHRALQFGLINIGIFKVHFGSGQPPMIDLISELLDFDQLFIDGSLISEDEVGLQRDLRERVLIRESITSEDPRPFLTLTDGPLDLFYRSSIKGEAAQDAQRTVWELDQNFERDGILSAGYIDKPGSTMFANMLDLYQKHIQNTPTNEQKKPKLISDSALLKDRLEPGHRSALFEIITKRTPANPHRLRCAFFFLNVANPHGKECLARVEVPWWLAQKWEFVDLVHAILYHDAQTLDSHPYPYALHRAHELALVRLTETEELERLLLSKMPPDTPETNHRSNKDHWKGQK